jgi:hypothetical protein
VVLAGGVFPTTMASKGQGPDRWATISSPEATVTPLAGGWAVDLTAPAVQLALTRLDLPPGVTASLPVHAEQVLAVEAGALTLGADQGLIWLEHPEAGDDALTPGTTTTLLAGDGAMLQHAASATLRNDGSSPLQLLSLSVDADDAP